MFNILIVDDNANNRFTIQSILGKLDLNLIEATSGEEALLVLLKNEIDLIILDIQLPDLDGFALAGLIKSHKKTKAIPIIFSTAIFTSEEFMLKGYQLGAVDYILKPINVDLLLSKVNYYMSVIIERKNLLAELMGKNRELENNLNQLQRVKDDLLEMNQKWSLLGDNLPFFVELYNQDLNMIFQNNIGYKDLISVIHKNNRKDIEGLVERSFRSGQGSKGLIHIRFKEHDLTYEIKTVYANNDGVPLVLLVITDITDERMYYNQIKYIGYHDQLTDLWNRRYFLDYVSNYKLEVDEPVTIMMADVNGLKLINDAFGHTAGDELIKTAAIKIKEHCPEEAVVARWGGDEFLVFMPGVDENQGHMINQSIHDSIKGYYIGDQFPVSIALGIVTSRGPYLDLENLIRDAEDKMYISKTQDQTSYRSFVVESLKNALYEQDYETKEHTERISEMALLVAQHLDLSQGDKDKLALLGGLHDIGKIGVPSSILHKDSPLSDIDWNIIKRHPEIGYRICTSVPDLSPIADLILCHHERWDGKGYPRGLKGDDIPILSRLIAVLDTFDVITHDRPYKSAQSAEYALEEIKRCSGSQFDPNIVKVFVHVYTESIADRH